jgi:hypothetical protein
MTGWQSKKASDAIRWLGPYAPTDRHADDTTLSELIKLRVENEQLRLELAEVKLCSCRTRDNEVSQMFDDLDIASNKFNGGD